MDRLCGVLFLLVLVAVAHSQGEDIVPTTQLGYCTNITVADLGSTVNLTEEGLIAGSITATADGSSQRPMIKILDFKFVCEVAGYIRNTIGAVSVVVKFECLGDDCESGVDSPTPVTLTEQYTYSCNPPNVAMPPPPGTISGTLMARSITTSANLNTPLSVRCGECTTASRGDDVTHCRACSTSCGGQGRCLATTNDDGSCCSYYLNDACVTACPTGLTGDSETYDCGCGQLTPGNVGTIIAFSDRTRVGSVATHSCNREIGYELPGTTVTTIERTCSQDVPGWSGNNIICQLHSCDVADVTKPEFGTVSYPSISFGSVATFSCDTGYTLSLGDATRVCEFEGWSGANPTCGENTVTTTASIGGSGAQGSSCTIGCIIGIILAILGAIIIAAIVAGVAYGIYSYLNHPDTKLAKLDGDGINGVARNNPLYVDPEAVVGAGDGAEAA